MQFAEGLNVHFDFSPGDAEPEIVNLAREVLPDDGLRLGRNLDFQ